MRWSIQHSDDGSWVEVAAHVDALDPLAALLLRLGGRVGNRPKLLPRGCAIGSIAPIIRIVTVLSLRPRPSA